jgi:Protein of unknown function (DUF2857)
MIAIESPEVKAACLLALVDQTDKGQLEHLLSIGHHPKTLDELRQLSSTDLSRMSKVSALKIYMDVDPQALSKAISSQRITNQYDHDMAYFVEHGATLSMLRKYFSGDDQQISHFRDMLQGAERSQLGRTKMPSDTKLRDSIHAAAAKLFKAGGSTGAQPLTRTHLIDLHKQFSDMRLDVLLAVLNEFQT